MGRQETPIQAEIYKALRADERVTITRHNVYKPGYHVGRKAPKSEDGVADLILCVQGAYVEMDTKAHNGKPEDSQLERMVRIRNLGGYYVFVQSVAQAQELVNEICRKREKP